MEEQKNLRQSLIDAGLKVLADTPGMKVAFNKTREIFEGQVATTLFEGGIIVTTDAQGVTLVTCLSEASLVDNRFEAKDESDDDDDEDPDLDGAEEEIVKVIREVGKALNVSPKEIALKVATARALLKAKQN